MYPKRVGSGFFPPGGGMTSSISSLRDLEITTSSAGGRSASPSPFQPQRSYSPPTPTGPGPQAQEEQQEGYNQTVDVLKRDHLEAARKAVQGEELREELVHEIEADCEGLRGFLAAAQVGLAASSFGVCVWRVAPACSC